MEIHKHNKIMGIAIIALLFAVLAFSIGGNITNNSLGLQIIVNNTNLAPTIEPNMTGTGERVSGTTYYNNNSDIEIFLYAHASTVAQTSDIELYINGTMISSVSSKPVGSSPEQNNKSIIAIIPKYSAYKALFTNYHHYEWREYPIISGNGTTNITNYYINVSASSDNLKLNKSTVLGENLSMNNNSIIYPRLIILSDNTTSLLNITLAQTQPLSSSTSNINSIRYSKFNLSNSSDVIYMSAHVIPSAGTYTRYGLFNSTIVGGKETPYKLLNESSPVDLVYSYNNASIQTHINASQTYWMAIQSSNSATDAFYYGSVADYETYYEVRAYGAYPATATPTHSTTEFNILVGTTTIVTGDSVPVCIRSTQTGALYGVLC